MASSAFVSRIFVVFLFGALSRNLSAENELYNGVVKDDVCEDKAFTSRCDVGKSVFIKSAVYGRMDKVCGLYYKKECRYDVFSTLDSKCQNETHCSVKSSQDVFGNPCRFYESSYLEVQYWCIHRDLLSNIQTQKTCSSTEFAADCGDGLVMQILSARYGDGGVNSASRCGVDVFNHINSNCSSGRSCRKNLSHEQFYRPCADGSSCLTVRYLCLPQSSYVEMTTPSYSTEPMPDFITWQPAIKFRPTPPSPLIAKTYKPKDKSGFNELEIVVYTVVTVITGIIIVIIAITCYNFCSQRKPGVKENIYVYSDVEDDAKVRQPIEMTDMNRGNVHITNAPTEPSGGRSPVRHRSYDRIPQTDTTDQTTAATILVEESQTQAESSEA